MTVGIVKYQYDDEQSIEFTIFNTRFTRIAKGVFVEFNLADTTAARDQSLFLGSAPLFF